MKNYFVSDRLSLSPLSIADDGFILELLNTPGWLKFIGDRNVQTLEQARDYISKISKSPTVKYWVTRLRHSGTSIGIITFIKRDYLEHKDIGFAFLPNYAKKGYALEATTAVLNDLSANPEIKSILATTVKDNFDSISLLDKMGFTFDRQIRIEAQSLLLYRFQL